MARRRVDVTYEPPNPGLLPPWASLAVVLLERLAAEGVPAELEQRIRIDRKAGGHGPVEIMAFLVAYFASDSGVGLRPFWNQMLAWGSARGRQRRPTVPEQLAALVGKRAMCSPASLSRALSQVRSASLRGEYEWLLLDVPNLLPLLKHPAVLTRDTLGRGWHVFDVDPTCTVLRQRDLTPAHDDLREGRRRTDDIAAAGYSGRKRGETQFARTPVCHAGLGAWVYAQLAPGNGGARADLVAALDAIVSLMNRLQESTERAIVRLDGAYGGVPALTALIERGLPFVTRAAQQIMSLPEVQERLSAATWTVVPHAEVRGLRSAAEIGTLTLQPAEMTLREDGSGYAPVTVRAVVSRIPRSSDPNRGVLVEGWQYEVFLTTLAADAWPAAEVISGYHGRSACENRYAQEDREFGLDRIFCFSPDGQELATILGMMVWNLMIARGFRAAPPPDVAPEPVPREAIEDTRISTFPAPEVPPVPTPSPAAPETESPKEGTDVEPEHPVGAVRARLGEELNALPWDELLSSRPGWCWDTAKTVLRCPDGQELLLSFVGLEHRANGRTAAYFRTRSGACRDCPVRDECLSSLSGKHHKQTNVTITAEAGIRLKQLLSELPRSVTRRPRAAPSTSRPHRSTQPSAQRGGHILHPLIALEPGPGAMMPSPFLPAEARSTIRRLAEQTQFELSIALPAATITARHPFVAASPRHRRHGRTTWTERHTTHALRRDARVSLKVLAGRDAATLLLGRRPARH